MNQERINYLIEKAENHLKFLLECKKNQAQVSTATSPISIPYLSVIIDFYDRFIETMQAPKIQTYLKKLSELDRKKTAELYKSLDKRNIWKTEASFDSLNEFLQEALEVMQFSAVLCHHFYEANEDKSKKNRINNHNLINNLALALIACGITIIALAIIGHFIASPYLISAIGIVFAIAGISLITIAHLRGKPSLPKDEFIYFELKALNAFENITSDFPKVELKSDTGDLVHSSDFTIYRENKGKNYVNVHEARNCFFQHGAELQEDASVRFPEMASSIHLRN